MSGEDRGDFFEPTGADAVVDAPKVDTPTPADMPKPEDTAKAVDTPKPEDTAKADDDGKPRDENGRFIKHEKPIPVERHKDILERERAKATALQSQVEELTRQLEGITNATSSADIQKELTDLEQQHTKAVIDGDIDKATKLMSEINTKNRLLAVNESKGITAESKAQLREEIKVDLIIEQLQEAHPVLNDTSDEFDPDVVDMVLAMQGSLIKSDRLSPSAALSEAARRVLRLVSKPADEAPPANEKPSLDNAKKTSERAKEQLDKNLDTANKQPPALKDQGANSDKGGITSDVDPTKLSMAEFEALPEATKARLRGDLL